MISQKSAFDLQGIARAGGSLEVDGTAYSSSDLQGIARALSDGATLKLFNADQMTPFDMQAIARAAPGQVIFG